MYINKKIATIFLICSVVFAGCNKEAILDSNDSAQTADNHQVQNRDVNDQYLNSFFPYNNSFSQTYNGRFNFFESVERNTKVNFKKVISGNNREVWDITFEKIRWSDGELKFETDKKVRKLGYFFVRKNEILWMKTIAKKKLQASFDSFIQENKLPSKAVVICQDDEKLDLHKEKSGTHREIISYGTSADVRQFSTWYIKPDYSDVREIYTYAFKKNIGLISYYGSETQAGLNAVQLWNREYVKSDKLFEDFLYD